MLISVPLMAICYSIFIFDDYRKKQASSGAEVLSAFERHVTSGISIKDRSKQFAEDLAMEILMDRRVREKGILFVNSVFKHPDTFTAAVKLLKNVLVDKAFVDQSRIFSTDLLTKVIARPEIIQGCTQLFEKVLRDQDIIEDTVVLLKMVSLRHESIEIFSKFYQASFLRTDVLHGVRDAVAAGAYQGLASKTTVDHFSIFMRKVVGTEIMRVGIKESYIYRPLKDAVSFFYTDK